MKTVIKYLTGLVVAAGLFLAPASAAADGYRSIAKEFSAAASRVGVRKVAVLGLAPKGDVSTDEADYAAGKIAAGLCAVNKVDVVERAALDKVLGEHHLMASLLSDADVAKELSGLVRAEAAVTGEVFAAGKRLKIAVRLIDLRTGRVLAARELELPRPFLRQDFRDSVGAGAPETCGDRRAELDHLNKEAVEAKAKYWAPGSKIPGSLIPLSSAIWAANCATRL